ncbi:MAG: ABC transporter ATP-binding protein [Planctomycetes bacterium]|nr:ABC transporter ATP-binding protein [Planctomycetota bacterium]
MTALELQNLTFRYGRDAAVHGVSLSLQPGDCYGFLGHNGAGKTTVLRLALGLLRPATGSIRIHGIDALAEPRRARAAVGALVERPGFHLAATAQQNLAWLARLQGMRRTLAAAEAARTLELVGLAAQADRAAGSFSLGMRQRLGVAQALLGRPRLLLLDEPSNGLDPEGIADLRRLLRQLAGEGTAVLLSSHLLQELEGLCTRIGVLREGRMVVEGGLDDLRRQIGARHVVAGRPLPALAQRLRDLGLAPETVGNRLLVALDGRQPGAVARELTAIGDLAEFAPEPATLEAIYLRATNGQPQPGDRPPVHAAGKAPAPADAALLPVPVPAPRWRAFAHELRTLRAARTIAPLLLAPAAFALWSVFAYRHAVHGALDRVRAGELFSADAGSGHLAMARALQAALPVLALGLLWLASQSVAADLAADTLRNTLVRSLRRLDVLLGKLGALLVAAGLGYATTVLVAALAAGLAFGFGDLEEVSRRGDRQVLAAAADVAGAHWQALRHGVLPLAAVVAVGLCASALVRRPTRALAVALLLVLGPELLRDGLRDEAGWLLTSHLPTGLRDDSALGFLAAVARGAADALWPWAEFAVGAPLAWFAAAVVVAALALQRRRVG